MPMVRINFLVVSPGQTRMRVDESWHAGTTNRLQETFQALVD
jgi:hypothetical protein